MIKKSVLIALLCSFSQLIPFSQKAFFMGRSQALNSVRVLTGWQQLIYRTDTDDCCYTVFSVTPEYSQSFRNNDIAQYLFGCNNLVFSGSRVADRGQNDILADYFGLPSDFRSTVSFNPKIRNFVTDFNLFMGLDCLTPGLYFRMHVPIVYTKNSLELCENITNAGTNFFPAGYMSKTRLEPEQLPRSVRQALSGTVTFGDMREPLAYGKINCPQKSSGLAEVHMSLGWNWLCDWYHVGLALRGAIPCGAKPNAEFLFEPVRGNGNHWEAGADITGHVDLWQNCDNTHNLALYAEAHVTHLFPSWQKRSFNLTPNGTGSRYILLEELATPAVGLTVAIPTSTPLLQYQNRLVNAINVTTLDAKVSFNVQVDMLVKLAYQWCNWEFDLGYNLWYRSKEKLNCRQPFPNNRFAAKGDAQVYGFDAISELPVAVGATQPQATLFKGQGNGNANFENLNADNPVAAFNGTGPLINLNSADSTALNIAQANINTSDPAILLSNSNIDDCSGLLPRALSNKIFGYAGYTWNEGCCGLIPYLGAGVSADFANTNACNNSAYSQWALWIKGGISY